MIKVVLAAAFTLAALSAAAPAPISPLCRVEARASPDSIPGVFTVTVVTTTTLAGAPCPSDGYAVVRLESGRKYPLTLVTNGQPFVRSGILWYYRLVWEAVSGRLYRVPVRGLESPFAAEASP